MGDNYLEELMELSEKREHRGLIHSGVILYIQGQFGIDFPLKAAIYQVLENVPKVFPRELPELMANDDFEPTEEMERVFRVINSTLLVPLDGHQVVEIIKYAREYEKKGASE